MPGSVDVETEQGKSINVKLLTPSAETEVEVKKIYDEATKSGKTVIAIDFTHPTAVNPNGELYSKLKIPFVMGTTGGDREALHKVVDESGVFALIAPNMCKQIVAFQAAMETMATAYPGAYGGYSLKVVESHQSGKADTSGTAKKIVEYLNVMKGGEPFDVEDIEKLRQADKQVAFGVPEEALDGHAWHTYTLTSSDGSVIFEFKHNVCGRRTYAEGVVDAVLFLAQKVEANADKKVYDMIDVLKSGEMK